MPPDPDNGHPEQDLWGAAAEPAIPAARTTWLTVAALCVVAGATLLRHLFG